jgi:hypothetical protein
MGCEGKVKFHLGERGGTATKLSDRLNTRARAGPRANGKNRILNKSSAQTNGNGNHEKH